MNRMWSWLTGRPQEPPVDRIAEQLHKAQSEHKAASERAVETIKRMLEANDRLNKRPQ